MKIDSKQAQKIIDDFLKIQNIRQKALKTIVEIDRKTSEYKIKELKKTLERLIK